MIVFLQAHRLVLAQSSQWFHRFFQSHKVSTEYHVAFFNHDEQTIQTVIDIINGKEVVIPSRDKSRLVSLLNKLGMKWEDQTTLVLRDRHSEKNAKNLRDNEVAPSVSSAMLPPPVLNPSACVSAGDTKSTADLKEPAKDDFYAILDTFTETSAEELERVNHVLVGKSGDKNRGYKCKICNVQSKYFSQAKKHHSDHEFEYLKPITEKMKKAEMDRRNDEQDISKFEKAIGSIDKKRIKRALRLINEKLEKHVDVLDSVDRTRLPRHISEKCKQYIKNLRGTIEKADNVIFKLGD